MSIDLSILIVHYKVPHFLEHCLVSIKSSLTNEINYEIIVIDNASDDSINDLIIGKFPEIHFISNESNVGFGAANNLALKKARGKYVLYVNPDTLIPQNTIQNSVSFLEKNNQAGAIGVQMLDGNGSFLPESKRGIPTIWASITKMSGLSKVFPQSGIFNRYALGNLSKESRLPVAVLAGAYMMVRKNILDAIGGFDSQFFMYGEDIDLSRQVLKKGYENWYLGTEKIIHFKGESTKQNRKKHIAVFYQAMIIYVNKYYIGWNSWLYKSVLKATIVVRSLFERFREIFRKKKINQNYLHKIAFVGDQMLIPNMKSILSRQNLTEENWGNDLQKADTVVFCISKNYTYDNVIDFMQENKGKYLFLFGSEDAESIIGSNDKNDIGIQWK